MKHKIINLLEEIIRRDCCDLGWGEEFLDITLKA